jgi:DNA-binding transcriptional LysR family regulator
MTWLGTWEAFVKTVEAGSMAEAARRLDCSRAQVSKQLAELEKAFGVRLLERSTRRLGLTPSGEVFYEHALRVLDGVREAELALQNTVETPRGILRISASVSFGRLHVAPLLPRIAEEYPQLHCELVLDDQPIDLVEEKFDLALRLTDAPPENLVARKLTVIERVICASPAYLAGHGQPRTPRDLMQHHCFAYQHGRTESDWRLADPAGDVLTVPVRGKFQINNVDSIHQAVLQGHGIAILPTYLCGEELARGELVRILTDYEPMPSFGRHLYACYPASRVQLPKLQVFLEALEKYFGPVPPWERG